MADRAVSDDDSEKSVVDLVNDDRWQARLEEARARREVALREKASDDGSNTPKRKLMPWEEDFASLKVEPIVQSNTSDRVDFADRVDVMRETVKKDDELPEPGMVGIAPASPVSFDDLLTDDAIVADDLDWTPPPKKPLSAIDQDAPDVIDLATRYASTLTAVPDVEPLEDPADAEEEAALALGSKAQKNHPPALLIVGILALAVLPFTQTAPPLDKGPAMPFPPTLRLQPALGLTTAMLWRPVETSSNDWSPASDWALPLATLFSPRAPLIEHAPDAFVTPAMGEPGPDFALPQTNPIALRGLQPPTLDGAFIDRLPGAFTRRPAPRPDGNAPFIDTRAPSRLPNLGTGNEGSPRVAPLNGSDGSSLDVKRLEAVSLDDVPLRSADVAPPLAQPLSVLLLTILVPERQDVAIAQQYAEDAAARGHKIASIKDVDVSISSRNLRYFHTADRAEAERLATAYGAEARDFTWFKPKPDRGSAELWLEGKSSAPVAPVRKAIRKAVRQAEPEIRVAPTPQVVIVRKPEGLFSRLFGGHKIGSAADAGGSDGATVTYAAPTNSSGPTAGDTTGGTDTGTGTGAGTGTNTGTGTTDTGTTGTGTTGGDTTTGDAGTGDTGTGTTDDTGSSTDTTSGTSDTSSGTDSSSGTDTSSDDSTSSSGSGTSSGTGSGGGGSGSSTPSE